MNHRLPAVGGGPEHLRMLLAAANAMTLRRPRRRRPGRKDRSLREHQAGAWNEGYARGSLDAVAHKPPVWPSNSPYEVACNEPDKNPLGDASDDEAAAYLDQIDPHGTRSEGSLAWARQQVREQRAAQAEYGYSPALQDALRRAAESATVRRTRARLAVPGESRDLDSVAKQELGSRVGEDSIQLAEQVLSDSSAKVEERSEHSSLSGADARLKPSTEEILARAEESAERFARSAQPERVLALWDFDDLVGLYQATPQGLAAAEADGAAIRQHYRDDCPHRDPDTWNDRVTIVTVDVSAARRKARQ